MVAGAGAGVGVVGAGAGAGVGVRVGTGVGVGVGVGTGFCWQLTNIPIDNTRSIMEELKKTDLFIMTPHLISLRDTY